MMRHYPDLDSASDWLNQISHAARPIRSITQIWVVKRHQYGIFALVSQTSFGGETSGSVAKCRLFSQAIVIMGTFRSCAIFDVCERLVLVLQPCRSRYTGYVFVSARKAIQYSEHSLIQCATNASFSQVRQQCASPFLRMTIHQLINIAILIHFKYNVVPLRMIYVKS